MTQDTDVRDANGLLQRVVSLPFSVSYSESQGTKRIYAGKGYRGSGILVGFNSRWGGRCLWVWSESDEELESAVQRAGQVLKQFNWRMAHINVVASPIGMLVALWSAYTLLNSGQVHGAYGWIVAAVAFYMMFAEASRYLLEERYDE